MSLLRDRLIRLAHANPEMRKQLLPLLKSAQEALPQVVQHILSLERRNQWLANAGLSAKTMNGAALGVRDIVLYFEGNTYPLLSAFKKFGFRWNPTRKIWWIPYPNWKVVEQDFLKMIAPWVRSHPANNPSNVSPVSPAKYPWAKGAIWLRNSFMEDEAEETGVEFKPLGPNWVSVQSTYNDPEYARPPERLSNAEALKVYSRAIAVGYVQD